MAINVNIPLRNRQNQADQVRSMLEYRQSEIAVQQQENTILQVRNAQFACNRTTRHCKPRWQPAIMPSRTSTPSRRSILSGASTSTLVLQASSSLTQAQSNVLAAATNYEKSRVQLDLYTADTLTKLGIDMTDAEVGQGDEDSRRCRESFRTIPRT